MYESRGRGIEMGYDDILLYNIAKLRNINKFTILYDIRKEDMTIQILKKDKVVETFQVSINNIEEVTRVAKRINLYYKQALYPELHLKEGYFLVRDIINNIDVTMATSLFDGYIRDLKKVLKEETIINDKLINSYSHRKIGDYLYDYKTYRQCRNYFRSKYKPTKYIKGSLYTNRLNNYSRIISMNYILHTKVLKTFRFRDRFKSKELNFTENLNLLEKELNLNFYIFNRAEKRR